MSLSDYLYKKVKDIYTKNIDLNHPVDVWRMWVKKDSETWKNFTLRFSNYHFNAFDNIEDLLRHFFYGYEGDIETFAINWVAAKERESFFNILQKNNLK
ncbi:MAG: hypothetical protein E3K37_11580 [Candidatus Kuenenia sp.]|nr:hypothetical protein [Candidatus Kuenenia hertensis]